MATLNLQILPEGYGSYLQDILPDDVAIAAGAFSAAMQQIKNIKNIPIEKFAQVVTSLETTAGLNLINGTSVPTDTNEAKAGLELVALGSGPYGTYTYSDFFGCMSGLPYPWKNIQSAILGLQSNTLINAYQNLYLSVKWKRATVSVEYTTNPNLPFGPTTYTVTGVTLTDPGGGYGRSGAAAPAITISNGGSGTTTIGTDPKNLTTFGTVLTTTLSSAGVDGTSIPTATVAYPPGGSSFSNSEVQTCIDVVNAAILAILNAQPVQAAALNTLWNGLGTQLGIEQQARNLSLTQDPPPNVPPVTGRYGDLFSFPTMIYSFTDNVPLYSKLTQPNMAAQTLEAISDLTKVAGESIVGMMRTERNQARLVEAGIPLDDNIPDTLSAAEATELTANGTVANSAPAFPFNVSPAGYYDPVTKNFLLTVTNPGTITAAGTTTAITNNIQPEILGAPNSSVAAVLGIGTPDGLPVPSPDIGIGTLGISQVSVPDGTPFFTGSGAGGGEGSQGGGPIVPGSLAGSPYTKLIPPSLNPIYTSDVLLPASLSVAQAIEQVITCNCDCWVQ